MHFNNAIDSFFSMLDCMIIANKDELKLNVEYKFNDRYMVGLWAAVDAFKLWILTKKNQKFKKQEKEIENKKLVSNPLLVEDIAKYQFL